MLGLAFVVIFLAIWLNSRRATGISEKEFTEQLAQTRQEISKEVSSLIGAAIHVPAPETVSAPPVNLPVDQLQFDAISLSMKLLEFIEAQGEPPTPKYSKEQIHRMPTEEMRSLIIAKDKDFDFSCEYHFGGNLEEGAPQTADELQKQIMARFTLLDPWYETVRAKYELEYRTEVERMANRFAVEQLSDEILRVPVEGRMSREYIRAIAAKLWEMAYKVREKGIRIEKA